MNRPKLDFGIKKKSEKGGGIGEKGKDTKINRRVEAEASYIVVPDDFVVMKLEIKNIVNAQGLDLQSILAEALRNACAITNEDPKDVNVRRLLPVKAFQVLLYVSAHIYVNSIGGGGGFRIKVMIGGESLDVSSESLRMVSGNSEMSNDSGLTAGRLIRAMVPFVYLCLPMMPSDTAKFAFHKYASNFEYSTPEGNEAFNNDSGTYTTNAEGLFNTFLGNGSMYLLNAKMEKEGRLEYLLEDSEADYCLAACLLMTVCQTLDAEEQYKRIPMEKFEKVWDKLEREPNVEFLKSFFYGRRIATTGGRGHSILKIIQSVFPAYAKAASDALELGDNRRPKSPGSSH